MTPKEQAPIIDDKSDEDEGEAGSGDFGRPQLKPNPETLFEPQSGKTPDDDAAATKPLIESYGSWEYHEKSLTLYNKQNHKKLRLEELNAPSKLLKVVVGLATQKNDAGFDWDIVNLIKSIDAVAQLRFNKSLYQLTALSSDTALLDWRQGTLTPIDPVRPSIHPH